MAMEVVVLVEFEAGQTPAYDALLERVGALTLTGQGKLSFVGSQPAGQGRAACDIVAVGLARAAAAPGLLERWRSEGVLAASTSARILTVRPIWSMEPLALMFP